MKFVEILHSKFVFERRVQGLATLISNLLPLGAHVLDVGCGDGRIDKLMLNVRPDITIQGIDVLVRTKTHVPVTEFDGKTIPFPAKAFDCVMFVDVLHHTDDPEWLLREAIRVARKSILIKDHCKDGFLSGPTLRFMDWVGNAHHGVALPYNYWPEKRWRSAFDKFGLTAEEWIDPARELYSFPVNLVFGRRLHFVSRLVPPAESLAMDQVPVRAPVA